MAITLKRPPVRGRAAAPPAAAPAHPAAQGPGELFVDSRPGGAKVYLDGKMIGTTPMTMSSVAPGEHSVRLEHEGYRQWTSSVRIAAGQKSRVTGSLER
jgi:hypothetical protein